MKIPSVNKVLSDERLKNSIGEFGRGVVAVAVREALDRIRKGKPEGEVDIISLVIETLDRLIGRRYIINATGDPLSPVIVNNPLEPVSPFLRQVSVEDIKLLRSVVSENLFMGRGVLFLNSLTSALLVLKQVIFKGRRVRAVIATRDVIRYDGFDVEVSLDDAGYEVVEVGCTNKVHLYDYEQALTDEAGNRADIILTVSTPRATITGYKDSPSLDKIGDMADSNGIQYIHIISDSIPASPEPGIIPDDFVLRTILKRIKGVVITRTSGLMGLPDSFLMLYDIKRLRVDENDNTIRSYILSEICVLDILLRVCSYLNDGILKKHSVLWSLRRSSEELERLAKVVLEIFIKEDGYAEVVKDSGYIQGMMRDRIYIKLHNKELVKKLEGAGVEFGIIEGEKIFDMRCVSDEDIEYLMRRV